MAHSDRLNETEDHEKDRDGGENICTIKSGERADQGNERGQDCQDQKTECVEFAAQKKSLQAFAVDLVCHDDGLLETMLGK